MENIVDPVQPGITALLNIRGWSHLDAVLLASLATEAPLLLIGPHGTAKSLLVERLASVLDLTMRHYNASLLNYDDLVGIPMPDETGSHLRFITSPGTIWDANFVFFDEISRCRADLQNKLFPIIHERRVIGIDLEKLQYRWAAMNPPSSDEPDTTGQTTYFGSEPLDPALTDRFPYVVPVPSWHDLNKADRYSIVADRETELEITSTAFKSLIASCSSLIPVVEDEFSDWLADYVLCVMDLLEQAGLPQSPRRARMLAQSIVAVHAARLVLEGEDIDPVDSVETAILYGMPQNATDQPPTPIKLVALHRQAWQMMSYLENEAWRPVMEEYDLARRVALADQLGFMDEDLSRLVTQTLGSEESDARQIGLATAIFLAFRNRRNLDPSAYEPLAQLAYHVLEPRLGFTTLSQNAPEQNIWTQITNWINQQQYREDTWMFRLERNFVLQGFPALWRNHDWNQALQQFKNDLILFGIMEETA